MTKKYAVDSDTRDAVRAAIIEAAQGKVSKNILKHTFFHRELREPLQAYTFSAGVWATLGRVNNFGIW